MSLTLIGLGLTANDVTLSAAKAIKNAQTVILKTSLTANFSFFKENNVEVKTLDHVFNKSRNFNTLTANLVKEIYTLSKDTQAVYCVEGSTSEDNACREILKKHPDTPVIAGISKVTSAMEKIGFNGGYTVLSAYDVSSHNYSDGAVCVYDIDNATIASEVKLRLMELYGDECPCVLFHGEVYKRIPLFECDRDATYDYSTRLVILPEDFFHKSSYGFYDLVKIVRDLRAENGCPWDKEQTHESIRINAIEEVYELVDAIDRKDDERMQEELGDVLLQVVFHAVMAEERGSTTENEVITAICKKLIGRHTHIFFGDVAETANQALDVWEKNKLKEHNFSPVQAVADVPKSFPALLRCEKVQKRAEKAGCVLPNDIQTAEAVINICESVLNGNSTAFLRDKGDLLFLVVNLLRKRGIENEITLKEKTEEFMKDFLSKNGINE